jgi:UDP-N-acetylmuramyl tripeptide synthase
MIRIFRSRYLHWHNVLAEHPLQTLALDLGEAANWTTAALPADAIRVLRQTWPGIDVPGGIDAATLIARLALRLQQAHDDVPDLAGARLGLNGQAATTTTLFFACRDRHLGAVTVQLAISLFAMVVSDVGPTAAQIGTGIAGAIDTCRRLGFDQLTRAMVAAAARNDIPWIRVDPKTQDVQLGQGWRQQRIGGKSSGAIVPTIHAGGGNARIPTAMITGTSGKTTTTRMLAHILTTAGHTVGQATTDEVKIGTEIIEKGDLAGAAGAALVLNNPTVTAAVLETARGGIVSRGLYLDWCDVAALLNVGDDHIGLDGIATLDDMTRLKRKVIAAARRAVVLNADDPHCAAMAAEFPRQRVILFSSRPDSPILRDHLAEGGSAIGIEAQAGAEMIVLWSGSRRHPILGVADLPAAMGGILRHNIANAMAAAALAVDLDIDLDAIAAGLAAFELTPLHSFGRFNLIEGFPVRLLFDFAHNPPALACAVAAIDRLEVEGRRMCAVSFAGNKTDTQIRASARAVAGHFDRYVCYEDDSYRRGRPVGEGAAVLRSGMIAAGVPADRISIALSCAEAARIFAATAASNDFVAVFGMDMSRGLPDYCRAFGVELPAWLRAPGPTGEAGGVRV